MQHLLAAVALALALSVVPWPVAAQADHAGHAMPSMEQAPVAPAPAGHAGHVMPAQPEAAPPADHAGHAMPGMEQAPAAPAPAGHAGHVMPAQPEAAPPTGHAGHVMPSQSEATPPAGHAGHEAVGAPTVTMGPDIMRAMGVTTVPAARRAMQRVIRATGRVEFDERKTATVTTKIDGWVEKVYADYTGKPVKKGETMATLYSPEIMAVQFEFLQLRALAAKSPAMPGVGDSGLDFNGRDARALLAAARERFKLFDVGVAFVRQLEKTGRPVRDFPVTSPIDGYLIRKMVIPGTKVTAGEKLFEIYDLSTVWVIADIYPADLSWVRPGRKASLRLSNNVGAAYASVVDYVYPTVADETRTAKIRFVLDNPQDALRPGMYVQTEIAVDMGERLAVPREAVIDTGQRQVAYVEVRPGVFEMRHITVGPEAGGYVEVASGLNAGEKVAATAAFLIDSETRMHGGGAGGGHHH